MTRAQRWFTHILVLWMVGLVSTSAFAQSRGDASTQPIELIVRPGGQRTLMPIAVPDASVSGSSSAIPDVGQLVRHTLRLSGFFEVLGPDRIYFDASREGMDAEGMNFRNWTNVGAQGVVRMDVRLAGGQAALDFRLFDVVNGSQLPIKWSARTVTVEGVRAEVYNFVNAVIEYYTGSPGPFGGRVAFAARGRSGFKQIYTVGVDGHGLSAVTSGDTIHLLPSWGPGGQVMYTSYRDDNPDLWIGPTRSARKLSAYDGINSGASLSPDGTELAITLSRDGNTEIYVLNTEGQILRRCTSSSAEDLSPTWSPDGSQIAFVSDRAGGPQIYVMNRDCSGTRRLTFRGTYNVSPDWSPDGSRIAFTGRANGRFDIFTVDPRSGSIERITQDQGSNLDPTWSPDGRYLIFASTRGGRGARLYLSTADGQFQNLISDEISGVESPEWRRR